MPRLRHLIVILGLLMSVNTMACGNDGYIEKQQEELKVAFNADKPAMMAQADFTPIYLVGGGIVVWIFLMGAGIHWYLKD